MLRLAGEEADGVVLGLLGASDVGRVLAEAGHPRADGRPFDVVLRLGVYPTREPERARRHIRRLLAAYLSAGPYAQFHAWLGREGLLRPMAQAWRSGDRKGALAAVPEELVDALFVCGPPEHCRDRIVEFAEAGVGTPVVALHPTEIDAREALAIIAGARRD
jgi:alkanesulfonate monooxygenase SsuD/methylene tetrahydromethanopterin reductase-like flavin-dependent oxidoreductase (luciferase family)